MQFRRRFLQSLLFTALLLPGLSISSFGANGPELSPDTKEAADKGALSLTLYLTDALHLTQAQATAVRECTRTELQLLAVAADAASAPDAALQAKQQYEASMNAILTPAQLKHLLQLQRTAPMGSTLSRVLASR